MEDTTHNHHGDCGCDAGGYKRHKGGMKCGGASGVYGLAFIGAAVYYIQQADTFWVGAFGILKAIAWPALLVYKLLGFLGM